MKNGEKKGEKTVTFEEEHQPIKPLIIIIALILIFVSIGYLLSKPELMNAILRFFVWETPNTCYIENELKSFISNQAEEYRKDFPSGSLEPSFVIGYHTIAKEYQICYTGNYYCKKTEGDLLYCSAAIMPFEVFCFKKSVSSQNGTQEIITCVRNFVINNRTLEVTSLTCEPAPGVVENLC